MDNSFRDIDTGGWTDGDISLTGPHWGPLEPSVGINASRRWTPTLEVDTNTKIEKVLCTTGRTEGHIILPLRGFNPVACGHMRCEQLQAAQIIAIK